MGRDISLAGTPHICFVAPHAWPVLSGDQRICTVGGAEVQQSILAAGLAQRGYRVSMVCLDHKQPAGTVVRGVTVEKCHSPDAGLPVLRFFHPRLTRMWGALLAANADIYYQRAAGITTATVGMFAKTHGRKFVYAAAHDLDLAADQTWRLFRRRAGWRDRRLFTLGLRLADAVVAQHDRQARDSARWYGRSADVVPSCYDPPPRSAADPAGVVLWVSTLREWKRPELFVELARRLPHWRFRMIGGASAEPGGAELYSRTQAAARAIPNLEFVGFVPYAEIESHFDKARVLVNTSVAEGFPNTFLQSWARGIPTVSFADTGSMLDGRPVVIVAEDLDDMAHRVETLMGNDEAWTGAGRRAQACYHAFHAPGAAVDAYERIFARLGFEPSSHAQ